MAQRLKLGLIIQAIDRASNPLRKIRRAVQRVGRATGLDRVGAALGGVGRGMARVGGEAARFGRRFGTIMAASGAAIGALVATFTAKGDRLAKLADRVGLDVEELQKLQHAFAIGGSSVGDTNRALEYFTRTIGDASRGTGEAAEIFEDMGIAIYDSNGELKPMRGLLDEVAGEFKKQPDAAKKAIAAQKLFGRSGMQMTNTLQQGAGAMKDLGAEAVRLGLISEEDARKSEAFIDAFERLRRAAAAVKDTLAASLLPAITDTMTRMTEWFVEIRPDAIRELDRVTHNLTVAVDWLTEAWDWLTGAGRRFLDWLVETVPPIRGWIDMARDWAGRIGYVTVAAGVLTFFLARGLLVAILALFLPLAKLGVALVLAGVTMGWLALRGVWALGAMLAGPLVAAIAKAGRAIAWLTALMLRNPFILLAVGIALAAWWVIKKWGEIVQSVKDGWARVKAVFDLVSWTGELSAWSLTLVVAAWFSGTSDLTKLLFQDIRDALSIDAWDHELSKFSLYNTVKGWFTGAVASVEAEWEEIKAAVGLDEWTTELSAWSIYNIVKGWFAGAVARVKAEWLAIKSVFDFDEWIAELEQFDLWETGRAWVDGLWGGVREQWDSMVGWIRESVDALAGLVPDWVADALGFDPRAEPPPTPIPAPAGGPGAQAPQSYGFASDVRTRAVVGGEVRIRVLGPPGTRVESVRSDNPDVPLDVTTGVALAPAT